MGGDCRKSASVGSCVPRRRARSTLAVATAFRTGLAAVLACAALQVAATQVTVRDAASGEALENAVVEVFVEGVAARDVNVGAEVIQRDAAFVPHVTAVRVGSAVGFPNRDTTRHHVFSFSPAKAFEIKLYLKDEPPPIRFERAGVVVLGCNIHDHMLAFIVVSEATAFAITGAEGRAAFADLPPGQHRLRVWHPRLEDTHQQWWEGHIDADVPREVALELRASPPPESRPSALQLRFRKALEGEQPR
tara:strand:- start:2133 stop:2876 length:744 start_codon:yes stop_codon:yes gene_type:complete